MGRIDLGRLTRGASAALGAVMLLAAPAAGAQQLPDGRVYEMVSPPAKNGGDVMVNAQRTWAAADGSAVVFSSLVGFGEIAGTGVGTNYLAERSTAADPGSNGWATRGISPPQQDPLPIPIRSATVEPMDLLFTPDLSTSVLEASSPLTDDPFVREVPNLYVHSGLRGAGSSGFELLTACPLCAATSTPLAPFVTRRYLGVPIPVGMSGDVGHVVFESTLRLTADAHDGSADGAANVYEATGGTVRLASILPDGSPAASAVAGQGNSDVLKYTPHVVSADGTRISFTASPDQCGLVVLKYVCGDLYLRDTGVDPAATEQVNTSERTTPDAPQPAVYWDASVDGTRVFFSSKERLTDDADAIPTLYMFDDSAPAGHRLTRVSAPESGLPGASADAVLGVSDDGHTVYFTATGPLVAGAPTVSGARDIYMWTDRSWGAQSAGLHFIGVLGDALTNLLEDQVSGSPWLEIPRQSRVSSDGRFLLFGATDGTGLLSVRGGSDYDHGSCSGAVGCRELYAYDAQNDTLSCASCRPDGAPATADATVAARELNGAALRTSYQDRAVSSDGRVFFSTDEPLVAGDVNGSSDAYEWDPATGVHLLSDGEDASGSYFLDASANGDDVFIATRARLVGWDTDDSYDLYDVRRPAPGHPAGFPGPSSVPPGCTGEGCRGLVAGAPVLGAVGSAGYRGAGNVRSRRHACRRGLVRRKVHGRARCVKRKHKRKHCRRGAVRRKVRGHVRCVRRSGRATRRTAGGAR